VAAVGKFRNPAAIALAVMERTEHVLLIGEGAERFALSEGFSPVDPRSLVHPREYQGYEAWVRAGRPDARMFFDEEGGAGDETGGRAEHGKRGTVGVVIRVRGAAEGSFALFAGASTGGTRGLGGASWRSIPRVGRESPLPLPTWPTPGRHAGSWGSDHVLLPQGSGAFTSRQVVVDGPPGHAAQAGKRVHEVGR